jgi:hypothetical protein
VSAPTQFVEAGGVRYRADDPQAPVNMHAQVVLLAPDEYRAAIQALQQALG